MTIQELHYDFKTKADKHDSLQNRNFKDVQIDWLINRLTIPFINKKYGINNAHRKGFERTQKRIDDLSTITVNFANQPGITTTVVPDTGGKMYEAKVADLAYTYLHLVRAYAQATKNGCTITDADCVVVRHNDLNDILRNTNYQPSFEWRVVPAVAAQSTTANDPKASFYLYSDGSFTIDKMFCEYLRKPKQVWLGTYDYYDSLYDASGLLIYQSGVDTPVTSELPESVHEELIDYVVGEAFRVMQEPQYLQLSIQKQFLNE